MYFQIISEQTESDSLLFPVLITVGQLSWRQAANKKTRKLDLTRERSVGGEIGEDQQHSNKNEVKKRENKRGANKWGYETSGGVGTLMETRKIRSRDCTFCRVRRQRLWRVSCGDAAFHNEPHLFWNFEFYKDYIRE